MADHRGKNKRDCCGARPAADAAEPSHGGAIAAAENVMTSRITVLCALLGVLLSIAFVDRPLSLWAYDNFHATRLFYHNLTVPVEGMKILALAGLIWCGALFASGRALAGRHAAILRLSLATLTAMAVKDLLKFGFGRTWPETWVNANPSFITDHVFAFAPFHGGTGWSAFPSGHEAVAAAFCAALWALAPRLRALCVVIVLVVAAGLIGADEHWLSDVIAGGLVGWLIGALLARVDLPKVGGPG
ncbi:phosphatase PAP2 family protein [Rhodoblastus acidophilus]|nr:phosphatase PAP2 family protein [Rhodoblastus acidophilus]RAI23254.1 phosphatase PAP2 family protein [Rhodoblastus acidophilus]